jgi:N-acetylglucosaminyl-diphospho-decaprenol L-rhamnosyltransferase
MLAAFERHPRAAFVVPRLLYPDGALQVSAGDLPTLREALLGRQARRRAGAGARGFWWDRWPHETEARIGRGHECCYLVSRRAIEEIGPQDERFRLDWEGVEWSARAADAGWEVWFTPEAEVVHLGGASIRQAPVRWLVGSHRGIYRYFAGRTRPALRPLLALAVLARGALKALGTLAGPGAYERAHRG